VAAQVQTAHKVQFKVTISIGIAEATAGMSGIDVLIGAADLALYQAKDAGRDRVVLHSPPSAPDAAAE